MFYPHLNSYDIHLLFMNLKQRQIESPIINPLNLLSHSVMPDILQHMVHKIKDSI